MCSAALVILGVQMDVKLSDWCLAGRQGATQDPVGKSVADLEEQMQPLKPMMKAFVILGMIAALGGMAGASPIAFPGGPFVAQVTDYSVAATYNGTINDPGTGGTNLPVFTPSGGYYDLATHINDLIIAPWYPAGDLNLASETGFNNRFTGENWGVFTIITISAGSVNPAKNGVDGPTGSPAFVSGGANGDLVGIIYGGKDQLVQLLANSNGQLDATHGTQNAQAVGGTFAIYRQPSGSFDPNYGPGGRLAADKYRGVGFDGVGNPLPGAVLVAAGTETPGFYPILGSGTPDDPNTVHMSQFNLSGSTGSAEVYFSIDPNLGIDGTLLATQGFPTLAPLLHAPGKAGDGFAYPAAADLHLVIDDTPTTTGSLYGGVPWSVISNDPLQGNTPVPEPMTLSLLVLGSLAVLRRRRNHP
jgi:hypothetical protein